MLYAQKVLAALLRKREQFRGFDAEFGKQVAAYREALRQLGQRYPTEGDITAQLEARTTGASVGALPTQEYARWRLLIGDQATRREPVLPFGQAFAHHQEARAWAERIRGIVTLAVDGSQLQPWRDASLPVALVQVGLFENPHDPVTPYVKDVVVDVLTPSDLTELDTPSVAGTRQTVQQSAGTGAAGNQHESPPKQQAIRESFAFSEQIVNLRRYELEIQTIVAWMRRFRERPKEDQPAFPVVFYDGSLVVSFALTMPPTYRDRYISAALSLLEASETYRVPLIGYIDTSYARDVTTLLARLFPHLPETKHLHDALLWQGALAWGDRTPAFISARGDVLVSGYGRFYEQVAFVYLQTVSQRPPARLEFPRWVLNEGILDDVLDVVRSEVIAGSGGYPYAIETADAVAVISLRDREEFYRIFQGFLEEYDLEFSFSSKALSKRRRRI
jgi:hypothetical protein